MAQIGTIGVETQNNGTVKVPVFDTADAGSGVHTMWRVQTASGVGFVPLVDPADANLSYIRVQSQNHGVVAVHNKASLFTSYTLVGFVDDADEIGYVNVVRGADDEVLRTHERSEWCKGGYIGENVYGIHNYNTDDIDVYEISTGNKLYSTKAEYGNIFELKYGKIWKKDFDGNVSHLYRIDAQTGTEETSWELGGVDLPDYPDKVVVYGDYLVYFIQDQDKIHVYDRTDKSKIWTENGEAYNGILDVDANGSELAWAENGAGNGAYHVHDLATGNHQFERSTSDELRKIGIGDNVIATHRADNYYIIDDINGNNKRTDPSQAGDFSTPLAVGRKYVTFQTHDEVVWYETDGNYAEVAQKPYFNEAGSYDYSHLISVTDINE